MKQAILATAVALAGFLPVSALRAQTTDPVSQRLMQIDLDVATRHYEKLQGMLRDSRLEQLVNDGSLGENHPAQAALQRKIAVLEQLTDETRSEILKLGQALMEAGVPATSSAYSTGSPNRPVAANAAPMAGNRRPGITTVDPALVPPSAGIPGGSGPPLPTPGLPVEPPQPPKPGQPGAPPVDYPIEPKPMPVAPAVPGATGAGGNYLPPATTPPPAIQAR